MSRRTLAWSGRPRTAWAVALRATCQPSRSATATASSTVATGNRGGTSRIPNAPSSSAVSGAVSSRPSGVPASTWFTTRRAATSSVSSIGTAPGRGPASARTRTAPPRRRSRRRRHRSGAAGPVRRWSRRSSTAGGSPGTPRSAVCWSAATSSKARITSSVPWSNTFTAAHTTGVTRGIGQGGPSGFDEGRRIGNSPDEHRLALAQQADGVHGVPHLLRQGHRVGDDPDSRPGRQWLPRGDLGHVDHRAASVHHHHPGLSEQGVDRLVGACPRPPAYAGVDRPTGPSRGEDHHRLAPGQPAGDPGELAGVADGVQRQQQTRVAGSSSQYCITSFAVTSA